VDRLRLPKADILSGSESRYRLLAPAFGSTQGQKAQFLLPFFCASKKGSRRKGETKSKDNQHRRTRSALIFSRYIILASAMVFVSFMEALSENEEPQISLLAPEGRTSLARKIIRKPLQTLGHCFREYAGQKNAVFASFFLRQQKRKSP